MAEKPRVAIIGDGNVGSALREGLSKAGYAVEATGNDPDRVRGIVQDADVVFLAVPFNERRNAIEEAGEVEGKIVVDVTNAVDSDFRFTLDLSQSGAEEVQEMAQGALVVKSFNMVFAAHMKDGQVNGEKLSLFVAGDDDAAKETVQRIGRDLGFETLDAGPLKNAKWLETLGYLNIQLGYGQHLGQDVGFRYVHADGA